MNCRLQTYLGTLAVVVIIFITFLDAKPQLKNDKYDSGPQISKLTFDEKLALSSKNRPQIKIEQGKPHPMMTPFQPITFPPFKYPTWAPLKPLPTLPPMEQIKYQPWAPLKPLPTLPPMEPIKYQPWGYTWTVPTYAPIKSWPVMPTIKPLKFQQLPIYTAPTFPEYHPTKLDSNLKTSLSSSYPGHQYQIQDVGNSRSSNTISVVLISNCGVTDTKCAVRDQAQTGGNDANLTKDAIEKIYQLLTDGDETYSETKNVNGTSDRHDSTNFLSYINSIVPRNSYASNIQNRAMNTQDSGISEPNSDSSDSLPSPNPPSTTDDNVPSDLTIPGSVGVSASRESTGMSSSTSTIFSDTN